MKQFSCGDVVPGCSRTFTCASEEELLSTVAHHARADHGMTEMPAGLIEQVRGLIVSV